jgi:hypothetical protein
MRALVALVLLACLAVGAWFVFARTEVQAPPADAGLAAASDDPVAAPATAQAPAATPQPPGSRTAVDADVQKRQAAPTQFSGPVGEVQVVRHPGKEPIAEATVYYMPPDFDWSKMGRELQKLARTDNDAFQMRVSVALTTDGAGRCRVPLGRYGTGITAVKDALWGQAHIPKDTTGPTVLALRPDRTLRVLVVGAGGSPAPSVRVLGKRKEGDQPMTWHLDGSTDAAGRYEQRHIQQFAGKDEDAKIEFAAMIPGGEGPAVLVDVTAPPPEVVLHLPPGGTVTVHVRDAAGQPIDPAFLGDPMVRLATYSERPTSPQAESDGLNGGRSGSVPLDERGVAVFGTVAFGRFVMAYLTFSLRSSVVSGPTAENPRVELTLTEGTDAVVLTGTLLDAEGRPLVSSAYQAICTYKNGMGSQQCRTDGAGRFRVGMGPARAGPVTLGFDTKVANTDNPLAVELPPRELAKGRNDLGEVRLLAHAILVQGKVTGHPAGDPPQVGLQIERQRDGRWQQEHNLRPDWEASGAFTIRSGMAKGTPIRLLVQTNEFLPVAPIECAAGDTGIEIKLNKGGSARATFLVDDLLPIERLTFRFRPTDPQQRDPRAEMMEPMYSFPGQNQAKDGRLQRDWQGLKPGRYRLQALCAGVAEPLVAIDGVEVADGPCADPRLVDIDLRGRVRAFEVRAIGSDGKPIVSREAFVVIRSQGDDWCGFHLASGVVKIAAPAAVDLIVVATGHRTAFVKGVSGPHTVTLEAASEARIALELPSPLPAGAELKLLLKPAIEIPRRARLQLDNGRGMGADSFFVEETVVDAAGKATVPVRYPGNYTVEATVSLGRRGGSYIREFEPGTITLPAAGEVVVRMGQKGLDRALEGQRR